MYFSQKISIDVLVVEPDPDYARCFEELVNNSDCDVTLYIASDGETARDYYENGPQPNLVILDLHLPDTTDFEILKELKNKSQLKQVPVLILTSSDKEEDLIKSYAFHGNAFIQKPDDPDEFDTLVESIRNFWFNNVRLPPKQL